MSRSTTLFQDIAVATSSSGILESNETVSSTMCRSPRSCSYTRDIIHSGSLCDLVIPRIKIFASNPRLSFEEKGSKPALVTEAASYRCLTVLAQDEFAGCRSMVLKETPKESDESIQEENLHDESVTLAGNNYRERFIGIFSFIFFQFYTLFSRVFSSKPHLVNFSDHKSDLINSTERSVSVKPDIDSWGHFADFEDESLRHRRASIWLCHSLEKVTETVPE